MTFKCTKTCRNSEIGGDDPLYDALEAKRRALAIADERSKENVALRQENERLQGIIENMREIRTTRDFEQT